MVGVTGTNGKTTTTHLLGVDLRRARLAGGVIGTLTGAAHDARGAGAAGAAGRACATRARRGGHGGVVARARPAPRRRHPVRGRRVHEPQPATTSTTTARWRPTSRPRRGSSSRACRDRAVVNLDDPHGRLLARRGDDADGRVLARRRCRPRARRRRHARSRWRGVAVETAARRPVQRGATRSPRRPRPPSSASSRTSSRQGLGRAAPVPGRFELVDAGQPFRVVVDYAHTPDGLEQVAAARRASVAAVAGCSWCSAAAATAIATKRPAMGAGRRRAGRRGRRHVGQPAERGPAAIIEAVQHRHRQSRRATGRSSSPTGGAAIALALAEARPGDVVVVAGKGHETTQTIGDAVTPVRRPRRRRASSGWREPSPVIALLIAGGVALAVSLVGTRFLISWLRAAPHRPADPRGRARRATQPRRARPTMGGIAIVVGAVRRLRRSPTCAAASIFTRSGCS